MLWTLLIVILVIWLVANLVTSFGSGLIHLLLVLAVIVLLFQLLSGRRAL
jgi:hypothetical protein